MNAYVAFLLFCVQADTAPPTCQFGMYITPSEVQCQYVLTQMRPDLAARMGEKGREVSAQCIAVGRAT